MLNVPLLLLTTTANCHRVGQNIRVAHAGIVSEGVLRASQGSRTAKLLTTTGEIIFFNLKDVTSVGDIFFN